MKNLLMLLLMKKSSNHLLLHFIKKKMKMYKFSLQHILYIILYVTNYLNNYYLLIKFEHMAGVVIGDIVNLACFVNRKNPCGLRYVLGSLFTLYIVCYF